ncbi:zinc ABC transporter substrate-binding protein [Labrenzia sp. R4_2]|uniref:zinc ABC transporter substrate-binding protein n=1 Tax=Labrenzia sp. R4_2 TaxID=2821107 RepID=UPI001AD99D83|nr:zinc ABC transporter substrate-binding protein [Labrenzia sp. R4_2]MBO9422457.1 zinc ABC transporter substrate-binding protein [Labrenzia sp. R4_2]
MQNARKLRLALAASTVLAGSALLAPAFADGPNVVTTIKPVHSIAAAVMEGVGTPHILIDGAASPHGFALKPSQAFLLEGADVVFWVGPELTSSLEKPISSMADKAARVELLDVEGIEQLKWREGDQFDSHDHGGHDDHGHDDHADHGHDDHAHDDHDHDHDKTAEKHDHGHDDHDHDKDHAHDHDKHEHEEEHAAHDDHGHDHDHDKEHAHDHDEHAHEEEHAEHDDHGHDHGHDHAGGNDPHIWLNPENGIAIANAMAATLSEVDPANTDTYKANAKAFAEKVSGLEAEISAKLEPVKGQKFIVFHDAYHHFEHHYSIEASGAITVTPEALASAEQVAEIQSRVRDQNVVCVFQEPQFDSKLVNVVIEGSDAKVGVLDPLGTELANGRDLYPALLTSLADSLADCLKS